jgi:hypothetical protein
MPAACCCLFLLLDEKEPKNQGRLHRTSPRPSKGLTLRSRSAFCEGKRQAPLREGQALSRPLRALPRPAAVPPRLSQSGLAFPTTVSVGFTFVLNDIFPRLGVIAVPPPRNEAIRNLLRYWDTPHFL